MKLRNLRSRRKGYTFWDILIGVGVLLVLAGFLLPALAKRYPKKKRIGCISNLQQIGVAMRVYANDHDDNFPWATRHGNQGVDVRSVASYFLMTSNELNNPKVLTCRSDQRQRVDNFAGLTDSNISYFIGLDAKETKPRAILAGDRNLSTNSGILSGQIQLARTKKVEWTADIHNRSGFIGLGDGSAHHVPNTTLQRYVLEHPITPFRLLIP